MSGFEYQCDHCDHCGASLYGGSVDGECATCPACGVGRVKLVGAVDEFKEKLSPVLPGGEKRGGGDPRDPTGPFSGAEIDETLRTDISKNVKAIPGKNETSEAIDDKLPVSAYVRARRFTKGRRKMVREWKRLGHQPVSVQCSECRTTCVIAGSTEKVIDEAWERGLRYEVICDECAEAKGCEEGGIVAVQAEELREVQRRVLEEGSKGRVN